jgi:hypothetical protein
MVLTQKEDPEIDPLSHPTAICFLTKASKPYIGEKTASSTNIVGKARYPHADILYFSPCTKFKINLKI